MLTNVAQLVQATDDNITGRTRFVCWITKATNTEYVKLLALPRRQWLSKRASMLHCTYIACIVAFRKLINKGSKTQVYSVTHTISNGVPPRKMYLYSSPNLPPTYIRAQTIASS